MPRRYARRVGFPEGHERAVDRWKGSTATRGGGQGEAGNPGEGGRALGKGRVQSCAGQARSRHSPPTNEITDQPTNQLSLALRASHGPVSVSTHVRAACSADGTGAASLYLTYQVSVFRKFSLSTAYGLWGKMSIRDVNIGIKISKHLAAIPIEYTYIPAHEQIYLNDYMRKQIGMYVCRR